SADILFSHLCNPIGAIRHWHGFEVPAERIGVEFLGFGGIASHQFVPVEMSVRPFVWHWLLLSLCGEVFVEFFHRAVPAALMAVTCGFVEELLMLQREQCAITVGLECERDQRLALRR